MTTPMLRKIKNEGKHVRLLVDCSSAFFRLTFNREILQELTASGYKDWRIFKSAFFSFVIDTKNKFGGNCEVVLAVDRKDSNNEYWRHSIFPEYKAQRKMMKQAIPKAVTSKEFKDIVAEARANFPWKIIEVPGTEADDIVGVLATAFPKDNTVILGADKDYIQLTKNPNVFLMNKGDIDKSDDPAYFLFEHVIRGDVSDNIPNIFSDLDTLGNPAKRQKPTGERKVKEMYDFYKEKGVEAFKEKYITSPEITNRFIENRKLIDMNLIPDNIRTRIMDEYSKIPIVGTQATAWKYCADNQLMLLMEKIQTI